MARSYGEIKIEAFDQMFRRLEDNVRQLDSMLKYEGPCKLAGAARRATERAVAAMEKAQEAISKARRTGDGKDWKVLAPD